MVIMAVRGTSGVPPVTTHAISPAQHAFLAALDRQTTLAVARAYRACRQQGSDHHAAMLAAIEAYHAAQPHASETDARHGAGVVLV
jgi:hypothetical protein